MAYDTFHEAFTGEHCWTEALMNSLREGAGRGAWAEIADAEAALAGELRAHINVEETWVYPPVEGCATDPDLLRTLAVLCKIPAYAEETEIFPLFAPGAILESAAPRAARALSKAYA